MKHRFDGRSDKLRERYFVDRFAPFRKVYRSIKVCASVLRRAKLVCRIVITFLRDARRNSLKLERLCRRPIDRFRRQVVR